MPANYTGNDSSAPDDRTAPVLSLDVGSDVPAISRLNTAYQVLANFVAYLRKWAGLIHKTNTWTQLQTYSGGMTVNTATITTISGTTLTISGTSTLGVVNAGAITGTSLTITPGSTTLGTTNTGALTASSLSVTPGATTLGTTTAGATTASSLTVSGQSTLANITASGNMTLTGSNPTYSTAQSSKVTPANVCKAWGRITTASGAISNIDGYNFTAALATVGGKGVMRITLGTGMPDINKLVVMATVYGTALANETRIGLSSGTSFDIAVFWTEGGASADGTQVDLNDVNSGRQLGFIVYGKN